MTPGHTEVAVAAYLNWRHRLCGELLYFWGIGGALQSVATPTLVVVTL